MTLITHRPKGSMCAACVYALAACKLQFQTMPVIGKDKDGVKVVRCTSYTPKPR